ncbi:MAG: poly(A) polymerase, partial [Dictyoglomus sp.]
PKKILYYFNVLKNFEHLESFSEKEIKFLLDFPKEFLFLLSLNAKKIGKDVLKIKLLKEKGVPYLKGKDLLNLGLKGKIIGDLLKELFIKHFNKEVNTKEDELVFVKNFINSTQR